MGLLSIFQEGVWRKKSSNIRYQPEKLFNIGKHVKGSDFQIIKDYFIVCTDV